MAEMAKYHKVHETLLNYLCFSEYCEHLYFHQQASVWLERIAGLVVDASIGKGDPLCVKMLMYLTTFYRHISSL